MRLTIRLHFGNLFQHSTDVVFRIDKLHIIL